MNRPDLELLRGAVDMHAHTHPALFRRPLDDADLAKLAIDYGMRGFVIKDHDSLTTGRAYHVNKLYPEVELFGSIVLNRSVGGLDQHVVQAFGYQAFLVQTPHPSGHTVRALHPINPPPLAYPRG